MSEQGREVVPLPEYPFDWHPDARFGAVKAAQDVLMRASDPTSVNAADDAIEAAVKGVQRSNQGGQP